MHRPLDFLLVTLAVILAIAIASSAMAEGIFCKNRAEIVADLKKHYGEYKVSGGLAKTGVLVEIFVSKDRSWTVLLSRPDGVSCIASSGQGWRRAPTPSILDIAWPKKNKT